MAKYIILNSHYLPPPILFSRYSRKYVFVSRERDINTEKDDMFIFCEGENPLYKSKGHVIGKKKLRELPISFEDLQKNEKLKAKGEKILSPEYEWELEVEFEGELRSPETFSNLVYSLLFVDNYAKPKEHVQQKIRQINAFDFETIEHGLIYITRTSFGKLSNALPLDNRYELRQIISDLRRRDGAERLSYLKMADVLIKYIDEHFVNQGRLLVDSKEIIERQLPQFGNRLGLSDEKDQVEKNIFNQAKLFEPLLKLNVLNILSDLIQAVGHNNSLEERFEERFSRRGLPISLN